MDTCECISPDENDFETLRALLRFPPPIKLTVIVESGAKHHNPFPNPCLIICFSLPVSCQFQSIECNLPERDSNTDCMGGYKSIYHTIMTTPLIIKSLK
jgi:hypothetical protein